MARASQQLRPLALAGVAPTKVRDGKLKSEMASSQRRRVGFPIESGRKPQAGTSWRSTELYPIERFGEDAVSKFPPMERRVDYVAPQRGDHLGRLKATAAEKQQSTVDAAPTANAASFFGMDVASAADVATFSSSSSASSSSSSSVRPSRPASTRGGRRSSHSTDAAAPAAADATGLDADDDVSWDSYLLETSWRREPSPASDGSASPRQQQQQPGQRRTSSDPNQGGVSARSRTYSLEQPPARPPTPAFVSDTAAMGGAAPHHSSRRSKARGLDGRRGSQLSQLSSHAECEDEDLLSSSNPWEAHPWGTTAPAPAAAAAAAAAAAEQAISGLKLPPLPTAQLARGADVKPKKRQIAQSTPRPLSPMLEFSSGANGSPGRRHRQFG